MLRSCESAKPISDYIDQRLDDALNNVFITYAAKQENVGIILEIINSEYITENTKTSTFLNNRIKFLFPM